MTHTTKLLSGWGCYPKQLCTITRPEKYYHLPITRSTIARGQGRSYGDAALNKEGQVILTERLNRCLSFDKTQGIITAEAGITLAELLEIIIPAGWFLPVTPGTQYASLGGCIATDVHGKNHHRAGSFSQHVLELELIGANKQPIKCSANNNSNLFWSTVGGMGLMGIIGTVTLKLISISTAYMYVKHYKASNLEQVFSHLTGKEQDDDYTVAWLDCSATGESFGRGIIMAAHHATAEEAADISSTNLLNLAKRRGLNIPFNCPNWLLNRQTVKAFNEFYYKKQAEKQNAFIVDYNRFFYPLDALNNWNRLYGKIGFTQYQCVLPEEYAFKGIQLILETLAKNRIAVPLAVLKRFGAASGGLLSFPMPGYTLSLDISLHYPEIFHLLDKLDIIVLENFGRIYLAKDARLNAGNFRKMYSSYPKWLAEKQTTDPQNIFNSSLANRLALGN